MEKDGQSLLLGEDAVKLAEILKKEVKRPVKHGIITSEDKTSLLIKLLVEKVIPQPQAEDGEILCFSSPSSSIDSHIDAGCHNKTLEAMAKKLGYNVIQTSEGLAVIYSELGRNGFTGVGISVGAGFTSVTVAHKANPIVSFSLAKGGDWIDERTAETTGTSRENVKSIKESRFSLNTEYKMGSVEKALSIYYDALTTYIINNLHKELEGVTLPQAEYPVVLAGGSTLADGFVELFENKLDESISKFQRFSSVKRLKNQSTVLLEVV